MDRLSVSHGLVLVSFDKDFDKTDINRKEPKELINNER